MGDLVAAPHLGLSLVAGDGGLDRPVRWAHVCELEDPVPWLEGWELDDDGDGRAGRPGTPACLHRAYGGAQIAGLAISQDLLAPPISDRLREAADRTRFPVVDVSIEVPFVALSRTIAAANTEGAQHRLVTHLGIFDTLGPRRPRPPSRAPAPHGTAVGLSAVPVLARRSSTPRRRRRATAGGR